MTSNDERAKRKASGGWYEKALRRARREALAVGFNEGFDLGRKAGRREHYDAGFAAAVEALVPMLAQSFDEGVYRERARHETPLDVHRPVNEVVLEALRRVPHFDLSAFRDAVEKSAPHGGEEGEQ